MCKLPYTVPHNLWRNSPSLFRAGFIFRTLIYSVGWNWGRGESSFSHILTLNCDSNFLNFSHFKGSIVIPAISKKVSLRNDHYIFFPKWKIGKLLWRASFGGSQTSFHWPIAFESLLKFIKNRDPQVPLWSYWFRIVKDGNQVFELSTSLWDQSAFW